LLLWQEISCLSFQAIRDLGALWLGLGQVLHFRLFWGGFATSDPKANIILSTTLIILKGEEISCLSRLVIKIPILRYFGNWGYFWGICKK